MPRIYSGSKRTPRRIGVAHRKGPRGVDLLYNPTLQNGGCQTGGFAIAPIIAGATAIHNTFKRIKPATKLDEFLDHAVSKKGKKTLGYKVVHGVLNGAKKFLGYGNTADDYNVLGNQMNQSHPVLSGTGIRRRRVNRGGSKAKPRKQSGGARRKRKTKR